MSLRIFKYYKEIINNFRKGIWLFNSQKVNKELTTKIIITLYFVSMSSSIIYQPYENIDKEKESLLQEYDQVFLNIVYYSDLFNIIIYKLNANIQTILYIVLASHIIILTAYCTLAILYAFFERFDSLVYIIGCKVIGFIQQGYLWVLYTPSLQICLYCYREYSYSAGHISIAILLMITIILFHCILYFSRMTMEFTPKDELGTRFTNIIETTIIAQTLICFAKHFTPQQYYSITLISISLVISIYKVIEYIKDLPFCNNSISFYYGTLCLLHVFFVSTYAIYEATNQVIMLLSFTVFGLILVTLLSKILRDYIIKLLFLSKDYAKLPNAKFYFLIKYILNFLKESDHERKLSSYYLIMFIRNHVYQCKDSLYCPCKNDKLICKDDILDMNTLEKNLISLRYELVILQIINKIFDDKIVLNQGFFDPELKLLQSLFLMYHANKNIKAYVALCSLDKYKKLSFRQRFTLVNIREQMEKLLIGEITKFNRVLYREVIVFYQFLDKLKKDISKLMNHYSEFFYQISNHIINIDQIIKKGKSILKIKNGIMNTTKFLMSINPLHKELEYILIMYATLQTTDELTNQILQSEKISKMRLACESRMTGKSTSVISKSSINLFDTQNCIIFVNLVDKKFGRLKNATPNFLRIFGYTLVEMANISLDQLMPEPFARRHPFLLENIIETDSAVRLHRNIEGVYAVSKENYLFPIKITIKLESLDSELCIAAMIRKQKKIREVIMTYPNGTIIGYSSGLKDLLLLRDTNMKNNFITNFHITYIIPRLILVFIAKSKEITNFTELFNFSNEFDNPTDVNNGLLNEMAEEMVYLIFPKKKEFCLEIMNTYKKLMNYSNTAIEDTYKLKDLAQILVYIYNTYNVDNVRVHKALITYKTIKYNKGNIEVNAIELLYNEHVSNPRLVLKKAKEFIQAFQKFVLDSTMHENALELLNIFNNFQPNLEGTTTMGDILVENSFASQNYSLIDNQLNQAKNNGEIQKKPMVEKNMPDIIIADSNNNTNIERRIMSYPNDNQIEDDPKLNIVPEDSLSLISNEDFSNLVNNPVANDIPKLFKKKTLKTANNPNLEIITTTPRDKENSTINMITPTNMLPVNPGSNMLTNGNNDDISDSNIVDNGNNNYDDYSPKAISIEENFDIQIDEHLNQNFQIKSSNKKFQKKKSYIKLDTVNHFSTITNNDMNISKTNLETKNFERKITFKDDKLSMISVDQPTKTLQQLIGTVKSEKEMSNINKQSLRTMREKDKLYENIAMENYLNSTSRNDYNSKSINKSNGNIKNSNSIIQTNPNANNKSLNQSNLNINNKSLNQSNNNNMQLLNPNTNNNTQRLNHNPNPKNPNSNNNYYISDSDNDNANVKAKSPKETNIIKKFLDKQSSHLSKSSSNQTLKIFKKLLIQDVSISSLSKMNIFGIYSLLALLIVIIVLFYLFFVILQKYILYVKTLDFGNTLITGIATYGKYISLSLLYQDGMFNQSNAVSNSNKVINYPNINSKNFMLLNNNYNSYKNTLDNIIFQESIFSDSSNSIYFKDYSLTVVQLNINNIKESFDLPFIFGVQIILEYMNTIYNTSNQLTTHDLDLYIGNTITTSASSNIIYPNISIVDPETFYFLKNFPEYFRVLEEVTNDITSKAFGNDSQINIQSFSVNILIVSLCVAFAFLAPIYPIYYKVETNKLKCLSLLATFSLKDTELIIKDVKNILIAMQQEEAILEAIKIKAEQESNMGTKKSSRNKGSHNTSKSNRRWKKRRFNPLIFIFGLLIILSMMSCYYTLLSIRIIKHNDSFNQYYMELDLVSKTSSCLTTSYFLTDFSLSLYGLPAEWKTYYNANYMTIYDNCANVLDSLDNFWISIYAYLDNNTDITQDYINIINGMKYGSLCKGLQSPSITLPFNITEKMLEECENSLEQASSMGIVHYLTTIKNIFINIAEQTYMGNYTRNTSANIIKGIDYQGFENLNFYGNYILMEYLHDLRTNILNVIQAQITESYIFLFSGITMLGLGYLFIWIPFLRFTKEDFLTTKRLLCIFPIHIVMSNKYIKKWLVDNTKNSF